MKYDLNSDQLIEFNDTDVKTLLSFGKENYPYLLPSYSEYDRRNLRSIKQSLNNLAYLFFKEKMHAI